MPFVYYIFDYVTSIYTSLLYSEFEIVGEFLGFVLCITYLIFLFLYFREYESGKEAEQRNQLMEMKRTQTEKELEAIRRSERTASILRHDMRHFLLSIASYIENEENDKALAYINEVIHTSDNTAMQRYCKNKIVNLILSNGLENAIHAVSALPVTERFIKLDLHIKENKLLLSLKSTYATPPEIIDGLPRTSEIGHGFGTRSIWYVTEKLGGNCQFSVTDKYFVMQVII